MIVVIDNYDSFTYNIVQYLLESTPHLRVVRNDQVSLQQIEEMNPSHIVISPGPGAPEESGISIATVEHFAGRIPILGICLGHQVIATVFGGEVVRAKRVCHGKTSWIHHDEKGLFSGIPSPFEATRYHSLVVRSESLPDELIVNATTDDGEIMALRHRYLPIQGVQFHPESILSQYGKELIKNGIALTDQSVVKEKRKDPSLV